MATDTITGLKVTCSECHAPVDTMCAYIKWEPCEDGFYPVTEIREGVHPERLKKEKKWRTMGRVNVS